MKRIDSKNEETKYIYILSSHVSSACLKNVSKLSFGVCSYNAPLGQLASRDIGDEITLNNKCFVLEEKVMLEPTFSNKTFWDSINNIFHFEKFPEYSLDSLRSLLKKI